MIISLNSNVLIIVIILVLLALFLIVIALFRLISIKKVENYQEIIKSHRDLWKMTINTPEKFKRVIELDVDINNEPLSYEEQRFIHLILLHMTSAFNYSSNNSMVKIEKLKADFVDFLTYPLPRIVWSEARSFFNKKFVDFIENKNNTKLIKKNNNKMKTQKKLSYMNKWNILALSAFPQLLKPILTKFKDSIIFKTEKDGEITLDFLISNNIDLIVVFGYGLILKPSIINYITAINIHSGYLPYNRGPNPNLWAWLDGTPHGVTIHYIDEGIDTGDIINQKIIKLSNSHTLQTSFDTLIAESVNFFSEIYPLFRAGKTNRKIQKGIVTTHNLKAQKPFEEFLDKKGLNLPIQEFIKLVKSKLK